MTNPTLITTPFAENGDKNIIPESVGANPQNATMQAGFPPITQQKISEGGIPPERNDFNGILNLYGQHVVHLNKGLPYEFDQAFADAIGGYPLNARVMLSNGDIVQSTIANNVNNPNSNMNGWVRKGGIATTESISSLLSIQNPKDGDIANVLSYHSGLGKGGGWFVYDSSKSSINDGVVIFNGWVRELTNSVLTPYMGGAKADYIDQTNKGTDDGPAIQNVVAYYKENPCVIEFDSLAKHYIATPVIIPDFTEIIGNGAQIFGNGRANDIFYTGYYVNGVLTPLYDKPENTKFLTNTKIRGFRFRYCKASMRLRGMTQGCAIEDVRSRDCDQHLWSREHYFCTFRQSYADHCGLGSGLPVDQRTPVYDLWTLNGMINIETIQCSSAPLAYTFYSAQSTDFSHLDAESCETALRIRGELEEPDIHACYFENCGVVLDVSGSVVIGAEFRNNFINNCTTGILATNASGYMREFQNRWRGTIGSRSEGATSAFRLFSQAENSFKAYNATYPADNTPAGTTTNKNTGFATANGISEQMVTVYDNASGANMLQAKSYMGTTVPYVYFGKYPISNKTNVIPFCTHTAGALQADNTFSVRITTCIAYSEFVRGDFALLLNTVDTNSRIFGKFFGTAGTIEYSGFTTFTPTVTVENVGGVVVVVLNGIKNSNNTTTYQCRGLVKLA